MDNKSAKRIEETYRDSTHIISLAAIIIGILPVGIRYRTLQTSNLNIIILLLIFVFLFLKVVIWTEILNSPHNSLTDITRAIDLFTESFSSISNLITVLNKKKNIQRVWDLIIEAENIFFSLGLDTAYEKIKRQSKMVFICFLIVNLLLFTTDYFLLIKTSNHKFALSSFLVLAVHTMHNSCCLTANCFCIHIMCGRFYLLNTLLKSIQHMDITNLLSELPLTKPISHFTLLTMQQQIETIKLAHDKYSDICEIINELCDLSICLQIASSTGVIMANMYTVISMTMDEQYDFHIISHCLIWVLYRVSNMLILIFPLTFAANEVH